MYISFVSIDQIAAEALRLPVKERALLAASLWESLGDPFQVAAPIDDTEAAALALERNRELDCGEIKGITHEELMARLRQ